MGLTTSQLATLTNEIQLGFQYTYQQFLAAQKNWATSMCMVQKVDKERDLFPWVYDSGFLREGEMREPFTYHGVSGASVFINLRHWMDAAYLDILNSKADDTTQMIQKAQSIGQQAAYLNRFMAVDLLNNGDTSAVPMYDGQNYFANVHQKKPGDATIVYDNLLSGALSSTTLQAAYAAMAEFPTDIGQDEPMGLQATDLMVHPANIVVAKQLMFNAANASFANNTFANDGITQNVWQGMMNLIIEPKLTDPDDWYVLCNNVGVRPFVHLQHSSLSPFRVIAETAPNEPCVRDQKQYRWWGETYEAVYPTHPWLAIKTVV